VTNYSAVVYLQATHAESGQTVTGTFAHDPELDVDNSGG
jgi:hypothetical protein